MKKSLAILFAACLLMVVMFSNVSAGKEIRFWTMPNAPAEKYDPYLKEMAEAFKKETGITVKIEVIGWDWNKVSTAVATGEGTDVTQVGTTWNPQLAATGGLSVIDINKFGGAKNFMKASYESTLYKGKCYGVPWFAETRCLFYNKDMFAKAGVKPPKTQDELIAVAKTIKEKLGEGKAIAIAGTNAWDIIHNWAIILWSNGGQLLTADNKKAAFNSAAGIKAMEWYLSFLRLGLADKACAEYNQPQADSAFINEKAAMCYMGPWNIADIEVQNPKLNYGVVEPPVGSKGKASFAGGSNLVILKGSKNQKEALQWIQFLTSKKNLTRYTKELTHFLPPKMDAIADPYYNTGVWKVFKDTLAYATAYPPLGVWGDIEVAISTEFKNAVTAVATGKYDENTVKNCLNAAAEKVNQALAKEK